MGTRWTRSAVALLSLAVAFAASASTASALGEPDTGGFGSFRVKSSNGYSILVLANSREGYRHGEVLVLVHRKWGGVSYFAPATVTDTTIEADLGRVGRIALEFVPSGLRGKTAPVCEPEQQVGYDKGHYIGEFEIRGEERYTELSASRIPFSLHPYIDLICDGSSYGEGFGPGLPGARLSAWTGRRGGHLSVRAHQNRPGARVRLAAAFEESRGEIRIDRWIEATAPATALAFDRALRSALLRPPAPFSGSAFFRRNAERGNRWTGDLAVDFPGRSDVSLTGARFRTSLVRALLVRERTLLRPNLLAWPSTKPWPVASATSSPLAPS